MFRPLIIVSLGVLAAAPAAAATYSAKPNVPTSERFIARDITWTCGPAACQGSTDQSRPPVVCQSLAKHAGPIESFVVDGRAFSRAELDKCNSAAKSTPVPKLAAH